jgi:putative DNA primase/helicase
MEKNLYSKALSYAVQGYSIIPLKKDKKPLINSWIDFQKTPASEQIIEGWWLRHPEANIGIVTGAISGITVVDIDVKGDTVVPLDTFPPTFTVKTPSGGYHLYYQYDKDIKQTANTYPQFPHVDIRNDGGYVVGPGSDNGKGGTYTIVDRQTPKAFPRELFLRKQSAVAGGKPKTRLAQKLAVLKDLKEGDGRNVAMCSLLGQLLRGQPQQNYPEIRETFYSIADGMPNPLPKTELETIWNSIGGKAFNEAMTVDLIVNHKGEPYVNLENVRKIMNEDPDFRGRCVFDTFLQKYLYYERVGGIVRDLHDSDEITITREISVKYKPFAMLNPAVVRSVLMEIARDNAIDSARDYIESIQWDGVGRLDTWLSETYNVENNAYHQAVGSNWLKGLARRVIEPGCKFDYVLVLEGKQGTRKSTSLGILGGAWHVETTATPDNKDFLMLMQGNLIIEFSEGETLSRGEIKQLKALITTQFDKYRAPYERYVQTHPRRCVFAMTTNQTEYLKDETGNRRWLPVATVGDANIEWLRSNRDQLLAEALYRVSVLKETTYEFPDEVFEEQAKRQVSDPNEDRIVEWYHTVLTDDQRRMGITIHMAFTGALGMVMARFSKRDEMEIANVFRGALRLEKKRSVLGGGRSTRWYPADVEVVDGVSVEDVEMAF